MQWSYKTVHFSLKKEGLLGSAFLDETEIEVSLNEYGKAGWELVSFMEVNDGLIAVFKQPFGQNLPSLEKTVYSKEYTESLREPVASSVDKRIPETSSHVSPLPEAPSEKNQDTNDNGNDTSDVGSIRII